MSFRGGHDGHGPRNATEGADGRLLSVDIDTKAGWIVPMSLRDRWELVIGSSFDVLELSIGERRVGVLIHDSDHTYECERFELDVGLRHAADRIALITDNNHVTTALDDVLADVGVPRHRFQERPRGHFYPGAALGIGVISRPRQPQPSA